MTIRNEHDWVLPAVLIGAVLLVAASFAIGIAVGNRDDSSSDSVVVGEDLAAYTECLRDNGADVPLVESGDGELSITVFEGDVDPEVLADAMAACEDLAPGVIRGLLELGRWHEEPWHEERWHEERHPFAEHRGRHFWFDHEDPDDVEWRFERYFGLEALCELLEEGFIPPDSAAYDRLVEACLGG